MSKVLQFYHPDRPQPCHWVGFMSYYWEIDQNNIEASAWELAKRDYGEDVLPVTEEMEKAKLKRWARDGDDTSEMGGWDYHGNK